MRRRHIAACLVLASCLISPCLAADEPAGEPADEPAGRRQLPIKPLTKGQAAQILANADSISVAAERQIKIQRDPYEAAILDDVRDALAHSSRWEWYSRDRGILLAIPVKERLGLVGSYNGEKVLADVVRRLISQKGWGNPPVQVVFIGPEYPSPVRRGTAVSTPVCSCP